MLKSKKVIFLVILVLVFLGLNGCSQKGRFYNDYSTIVSQSNHYTYWGRRASMEGSKAKIEYNRFSGTDELWDIESKDNGFITFDYFSDVKSGKFKCVLISPDNDIKTIFELSGEGVKTLEIEDGSSRVKIVGSNASGEFEISVTTEGSIEVKPSYRFRDD
ncbi:hypothetical protein [Dethiobacter alkaliphilus]|uniref:hypothetical protein n=1 Tax=Dethiobacter alkaliphilus TaxID=427926 RepID=UPI002225E169|nr:hypothetical protein [Dethiobacter alkaliphilus]MCW3491627.1 hypothetical protein [Dethiobacter alkaliphilus]